MTWFDFKDFLIICLVFVPLERLFALRPEQKTFRSGWQTDLTHLLLTGLFITFGLTVLIIATVFASERLLPELRAAVAAQPFWLQFIEILAIADLGFYGAHRAFHAIPFLWRFHAVHHSIEELDWLAAHRVHPVDQILTKSASLVPIFALGFADEPIVLFAVLYRWQALLIHSNIRVGFGPLRWFVASPQFHHWHHANNSESANKNFAGQLSVLDLVFGTLHLPGRRVPTRYGTDDQVPRSYFAQLAYPFVRRRSA